MPRFNPRRWNPGKESSPGLRTVDPRRIVLAMSTETLTANRDEPEIRLGCPCGCGEMPRGTNAKFAMGHDARLRGKLIRAHLTGTEILYVVEGKQMPPLIAMQVAARYGWGHYLDAAILRREGKNREVLQRALGSTRLVRVGRWEYTGQVAAVYGTPDEAEYEIEYVTRQGDIRRTRVDAADTREAA